jgi:UDP-N-acetylmuramate dehydrogenase
MIDFSSGDARDMTTMHCGGRIARIYEPDTRDQLRDLISMLDSFIVLGGGSNMIFPDGTCDTPVIRLGKGFGYIELQEEVLSVGGAVTTSALLGFCIRNTLTGLEFLAGIPGTIGGALWMNAGTRKGASWMRPWWWITWTGRACTPWPGRTCPTPTAKADSPRMP